MVSFVAVAFWTSFIFLVIIAEGVKLPSFVKSRIPIGMMNKRYNVKNNNDIELVMQVLIDADDENLIDNYKPKQISNAIAQLTTSQSALKSLDGMTHQIRNTLKENTSLQSRFKKFVSGSKKNKKEAGKIYEYTNSVERSLQAAEILQSISDMDEKSRLKHLEDCGLMELKRIAIEHNNIHCIVSILAAVESSHKATDVASTPPRYYPDELVIAVADNLHVPQQKKKRARKLSQQQLHVHTLNLLGVLHREEPLTIQLGGIGFAQEEVSVQPSLFALSQKVLGAVSDFVLPSRPPISSEGTILSKEQNATGGAQKVLQNNMNAVRARSNQKMDSVFLGNKRSSRDYVQQRVQNGKIVVTRIENDEQTEKHTKMKKNVDKVSRNGRKLPARLRFVGHSAGAAAATFAAMMLDGTLNATSNTKEEQACTGAYSGKVKCIALSPPPCISRSVVPQFVRSVVCGDDVVPRATRESLGALLKRVSAALDAGAGSSIPVGYLMGGRWLKDVRSVTGQSLKRYTGSKHDITTLSVPGRVFFVKNRRMESGATIQRVLRGNWQEDVLWQLHEVVLSKKMLKHHTLDNLIQTLNRC